MSDNNESRATVAGNAAAMREALLFVKQYFDKIDPFNQNTYTFAQIEVDHIQDAISAALAAPPRQCDVGTAGDQIKRFTHYCNSKVCNRRDCACGYEELFRHKCAIRWAQMPCEAQEGGADHA